jgi:hypothetical protein
MRRVDTTSSWSYTTATWRQANNSSSNQLDFLQTLAGSLVEARVVAAASNSSGGVVFLTGIDLDTLNTTTLVDNIAGLPQPSGAGEYALLTAEWIGGYSGIGRHILIWKEYSVATGTTTWIGNASSTNIQTGMVGTVVN